jgi:hypothetical protein
LRRRRLQTTGWRGAMGVTEGRFGIWRHFRFHAQEAQAGRLVVISLIQISIRGGRRQHGKLLFRCRKNRIGAKRRRVMPRLLKGGAPATTAVFLMSSVSSYTSKRSRQKSLDQIACLILLASSAAPNQVRHVPFGAFADSAFLGLTSANTRKRTCVPFGTSTRFRRMNGGDT